MVAAKHYHTSRDVRTGSIVFMRAARRTAIRGTAFAGATLQRRQDGPNCFYARCADVEQLSPTERGIVSLFLEVHVSLRFRLGCRQVRAEGC